MNYKSFFILFVVYSSVLIGDEFEKQEGYVPPSFGQIQSQVKNYKDSPFWQTINSDAELAPYASDFDYILCGNTILLYGLVSSEEIKNAIEVKLKPYAEGNPVQNLIIVKENAKPAQSSE